MASLNFQDLLLKINDLKELKNLKTLNISQMYEQNLLKIMKDI